MCICSGKGTLSVTRGGMLRGGVNHWAARLDTMRVAAIRKPVRMPHASGSLIGLRMRNTPYGCSKRRPYCTLHCSTPGRRQRLILSHTPQGGTRGGPLPLPLLRTPLCTCSFCNAEHYKTGIVARQCTWQPTFPLAKVSFPFLTNFLLPVSPMDPFKVTYTSESVPDSGEESVEMYRTYCLTVEKARGIDSHSINIYKLIALYTYKLIAIYFY